MEELIPSIGTRLVVMLGTKLAPFALWRNNKEERLAEEAAIRKYRDSTGVDLGKVSQKKPARVWWRWIHRQWLKWKYRDRD